MLNKGQYIGIELSGMELGEAMTAALIKFKCRVIHNFRCPNGGSLKGDNLVICIEQMDKG